MVFDTSDKSLPSARKIGCAAELPAIVAIVQLILELASRENYQQSGSVPPAIGDNFTDCFAYDNV
jgi:hypothetical protein